MQLKIDLSAECRLVLFTGPSGAGTSTAIHVLEGLEYEVIDNIPLRLVPRLIDGPPLGRQIARGLDARNRDSNSANLIELIDTSEMTPHDLKEEIARWFDRGTAARMAVSAQSFSYKRGLPRGVDMVFDCWFLHNPYGVPEMRTRDGRDPRFAEFFLKLQGLVEFLLRAHVDEGKVHLLIGFGRTGGQHRSVVVAENLGIALADAGWPVSIRHRELERRAAGPQPTGTGL